LRRSLVRDETSCVIQLINNHAKTVVVASQFETVGLTRRRNE